MAHAVALGIDIGGSGIKGAPVEMATGGFLPTRPKNAAAGAIAPGGRGQARRPDRR